MITCRLIGICLEIKVKIQKDKMQIQKIINGKAEDIKYENLDSINELVNLEKVLNSYNNLFVRDLKIETLNNKNMVDEMMLNSKYKDLLLTSPYFNEILYAIRYSDIGEKEVVEIISILCKRISELEKDLNNKIMGRKIDTGLFKTELKSESLSGLFTNGKTKMEGEE